jgi:Zn-dependent peptidase ImmA (M78 family)/DNA-binding XRE family transcriptional regulator
MKRFNPNRLNEARIYRKMTMEQLATAVGINKQAISQFENGKTQPEFNTLHFISRELDFPISFFNETDSKDTSTGNTYFRALFSSNKMDMKSQRIKAKYVAIIQNCLSEYIDFRPLNLPKNLNIGNIEILARQVRDFWGLGQEPINDMVLLLERNGVIVSEFSTEGKKIDAFFQYGEFLAKEYYCVILGTDKLTFSRRQFSAAHELGHILMHEKLNDLDDIDRDEYKRREEEANKFASAFLLPKEAFLEDVMKYANRLNYYIELKRKWKVSISAMIMRAFDLSAITSNQYQYLMKQISRNGWRTQEPLDDVMIVKHPKAIKQAINMLILNNKLTPNQIFNLFSKYGFSFSKDVIDEVLNLEPDVLPEEAENESHIKLVRFSR